MTAHWSLGVLIGLPVVSAIALLLLVGTVVFLIAKVWSGAASAIVLLIVITVVSIFAYWPFRAEYHQWRPYSGTVSAIGKRLVGSGDGMEQKFVVRFAGSQQEYAIEDTRAALVQKGDRITIMCKRKWQWASVHGYDCNWGTG